jgi:hypothetical protein
LRRELGDAVEEDPGAVDGDAGCGYKPGPRLVARSPRAHGDGDLVWVLVLGAHCLDAVEDLLLRLGRWIDEDREMGTCGEATAVLQRIEDA